MNGLAIFRVWLHLWFPQDPSRVNENGGCEISIIGACAWRIYRVHGGRPTVVSGGLPFGDEMMIKYCRLLREGKFSLSGLQQKCS